MRLGLQLFATRRDRSTLREVLADLTARAVHAEQLGYDIIWLAEHHGTDWNLCSDPLTMLAHLAAATHRIKLGTAVVNLGLHHPQAVAERAILVNALSNGRLELGLGRGFAVDDYALFGVDWQDSQRRFQSGLDGVLNVLDAQGELDSIPLWVATTGNTDTLDTAISHGCGLLLAAHGQKLLDALAHVRSRHRYPRLGLTRAVHVAKDEHIAARELTPHLSWYVQQLSLLQPSVCPPNLDDVMKTFCVVGDQEQCRRKIRSVAADLELTDFTCVIGIGGMPTTTTSRVLEALAPASSGPST